MHHFLYRRCQINSADIGADAFAAFSVVGAYLFFSIGLKKVLTSQFFPYILTHFFNFV
jgi:hypothetical protein